MSPVTHDCRGRERDRQIFKKISPRTRLSPYQVLKTLPSMHGSREVVTGMSYKGK